MAYKDIIMESLRTRLDKLQQAVAATLVFMPKEPGGDAPTLDVMIQKLEQRKADNSLEMLHELAQEEPTTKIRPQTVVTLLQRKILELKKAQAAMAELEN